MRGCRTLRFICIASLLAAAFLPAADQRCAFRQDTEYNGAAAFLLSNPGPASAVYAPLRNQQQDLRELRPAIVLPAAAGLHGNFNGCIFARPIDNQFAATFTAASLLSLHCLLTV